MVEDIKLNVKKGTYEDMQDHYGEIGDKDFCLVEGKDVPIPFEEDAGKVISVNSDGEYELTTPSGGGGVPSGGTAGQVLSKVDNTDQNIEWKTITASDIPVENSQSVQDNLERIDLEVEGLVDDVADLNSGKLNASKNAVANVGGLVTPTATLSSNELVGIGTNGEQIRIQLGDGLVLEGSTSPFTLKASAKSPTVHTGVVTKAGLYAVNVTKNGGAPYTLMLSIENLNQSANSGTTINGIHYMNVEYNPNTGEIIPDAQVSQLSIVSIMLIAEY